MIEIAGLSNWNVWRSSARPGVYLLDAYLRGNFGDDLMVLELLEGNPDTYFVAVRPDALCSELMRKSNLVALSSVSGRMRRTVRQQCDGVVVVGGSMFIDRRVRGRELVRKWKTHLRRMSDARWFNRRGRIVVVGANIGPVTTYGGRRATLAFLRRCSLITVRDRPSHDWLAHNSIESTLAPDMTLSYLAGMSTTRRRSRNGQRRVGLSVMTLPDTGEAKSVGAYSDVIEALWQQDASVQVLVLGLHEMEPSDEVIMNGLRRVYGDRLEYVLYEGDLQRAIEAILGCDALLGVRLHSSVVALGLGVPVVPVSYSKKVEAAVELIAPDRRALPVEHLHMRSRDVADSLLSAERRWLPNAVMLDAAKHARGIIATVEKEWPS